MNKSDLAKAIAERTGDTQKKIKSVLDVMQDVVFATLPAEEVKLMDGVTLCSVHKDACTRRNPRTGESVDVEAKYAPKCKFGTPIKAALNA
ncbi:MAG: HU family DNA-binding protein [Elusimicrobiales bacterium]|nr:HU family DNA-binding protein [Elusimicrobiales bacterium]